MIRVVVIDDSALARKLIGEMLSSDPEIEVVGTAMNGIFGLRRVYRDKPDVVTMDFEMPEMDGLETLSAIMDKRPTPVVMLSSHTRRGMELTMKALELGAVDFVTKPDGRESAVLGELKRELIEKVKASAEAAKKMAKFRSAPYEVTKGRPAESATPVEKRAGEKPKQAAARSDRRPAAVASPRKTGSLSFASDVRLVAIGSSTGGVPGVERILASLPVDCPPVLVVQHMPLAFTGSFAARMNTRSAIEVREAQGDEVLHRGLAVVARGDAHLVVRKDGEKLIASIHDGPKQSGHKPSVDVLFKSCTLELGRGCLGIILTGMGKDGAEGILKLKNAGGRTIAESEESAVIFGMPKAAIDLGGAEFVLPTEDIPQKVAELIRPGARIAAANGDKG